MPVYYTRRTVPYADAIAAQSAARQAAGSVGGVAFDGLTSGTRGTVPLTWTIGTGDFSAWVRFRCPSTVTVERGVIGLGPNATDAGGTGSFRVILQTTGTMSVRLGTAPETLDFAGFVAAFGGQWVDVVVTRGSAGWTVYVNGLAATPTSGSLTTAATVTSSNLILGVGLASTNIFNSIFHRVAVFNRTLSAADVASLVVAGVSQADQWGAGDPILSPTVLNGGFETAGTTNTFANWTDGSVSGTTINRDTVVFDSGSASLRFDVDGSGSFRNVSQGILVAGRRYRVTAAFRHNHSSSIGPQIQLQNIVLPFAVVAQNTWQTQTAEGVADGTIFNVSRRSGAANSSQWYDSITVTRIGAIVDLDFTMGCGNQLQDASSNGFHVNLFGGFSWVNPRDFGQLRVSLSASGNTQFPVGLPAEAMITGIAANAAGAVTLSIGTASGGTQVVNAAALSTGRNGPLTVASAFPGGTLWGNLSAAVATNITIDFSLTT